MCQLPMACWTTFVTVDLVFIQALQINAEHTIRGSTAGEVYFSGISDKRSLTTPAHNV